MKKIFLILVTLCMTGTLYAQQVWRLEDCRAMALEHNKNLQIARETLEAAEQMKKAALTQFLPSFNAIGSYTWNEKSISLLAEDALLPVGTKMGDGSFGFSPSQISNNWTIVNGQPVPLDANGVPFNPSTDPDKIIWKEYAYMPKESMEFDTRNIFAGGISFVQPVYMGGKIRELYRLSKCNEKLAAAQQESQTTDILVEVDEAYWRVISLESKVNLAREYRDLIAKMDTNVSILIEEGQSTRADALKVKVKLNEAEMSLTKAENGLNLSRMVLNQLCGMPLEDRTPLDGQQMEQETVIPEMGPVAESIDRRPEIQSLIQIGNIAHSNTKIMESRFLPNIGLTGNYLYTNPNIYNGFEKKFDGMFSVGVVATVPIFHFGDKIHTLKAARAEERIAGLKLADAKEMIELQIRQSALKINESIRNLNTAQRNVEQAEENLRTASEGFSAGVITSTDLIAAQTAWLGAKSEWIDAAIEVRLCKLYLEKALGTVSAAPAPATDPGK